METNAQEWLTTRAQECRARVERIVPRLGKADVRSLQVTAMTYDALARYACSTAVLSKDQQAIVNDAVNIAVKTRGNGRFCEHVYRIRDFVNGIIPETDFLESLHVDANGGDVLDSFERAIKVMKSE